MSRPDTPWHDVCPQGPCAYPHCPETGLYPAPKGRDRLREYFWFCLEHVREYNKTWNYYEGMAEPEIEAHIRRDTVWQRPTWPLGRWGSARGARAGVDIHDGFGPIFGEAPDARRQSRHGGEGARAESAGGYGGEHDRALAVLQLKWPVTITEIKLRYKALVKQLHPDANGGDKAAEEFLKVVNQAYSTLKNSSLFRASAAPGAHP